MLRPSQEFHYLDFDREWSLDTVAYDDTVNYSHVGLKPNHAHTQYTDMSSRGLMAVESTLSIHQE